MLWVRRDLVTKLVVILARHLDLLAVLDKGPLSEKAPSEPAEGRLHVAVLTAVNGRACLTIWHGTVYEEVGWNALLHYKYTNRQISSQNRL